MPSPSPHSNNPIKHLKDFYSPQPHLFQNAIHLPQFFQTNLVDDARVVKYFPKDPQANIRIFYYQYLKLCFEIDNVDYQTYIDKIYQLIRTQGFEFYFHPSDPLKELKNAQYKSLLVDFFQIMNTSSLTIDQVLTQYPILDQVFINFFRSVLIIASVTNQFDSYIQKNQLFDFLSSFFSVDISSYDKCLKFVQSDIFVFEEDPQNIYMAYIKDDEEDDGQQQNQGSDQNIEVVLKKNNLSKFAIQRKSFTISQQASESTIPEDTKSPIAPSSQFVINHKPKAKLTIKQSYIEGQFADYTSYHNKGISAFGKNFVQESEKDVGSTAEQTGTFVQIERPEANFNQISDIEHNNEIQKERKRILSTEHDSKFEFDPTYDQQEFSQSLTSHNRKKLNQYQFSPQTDQKQIDSLSDQTETFNLNYGSKQHLQNEEMSNSKENSKKEIIFPRNHLYQNYEEPTKDPGFGSSQGLNVRSVDSTIYNQSKLKSAASYQSSINEPYKSSYVQEPLFHKPSIPIPTLMNQNSLSQNSRMVTSSKFMKDSQGPVGAGLIKQHLKLNVTKQFTNSFVMKNMSEPFKSNVYKTRQRARQFRKNIFQQLTYQPGNTASTNDYNVPRSPSSRTNFPSSSTVERASSSNNLAAESNARNESQSIKNINNEVKQKVQQKAEPDANISLSRKLFEVKESTPPLSEQGSKTYISLDKGLQSVTKEYVNQVTKVGSGLQGPSIVVNKQVQYQNQQNPHYSQFNQPQQHISNQSNNQSPYQIPQQNLYKGTNLNGNQMSKPPSYNYGKFPQNPSQHYAGNVLPVQPTKLNKQQPINMYKEIANNMIYAQSKGSTQRAVNHQEMMYNQQIKKPVPVFIPYERRT